MSPSAKQQRIAGHQVALGGVFGPRRGPRRRLCDRLSSLAPARAAASVAVRSSVRTNCIQATSTANAAMMMHSGKQTAINTSIAAAAMAGSAIRDDCA